MANYISFTTHHLQLGFLPTDALLSTGTGFIYRRNDSSYLITNWHNVAGRDNRTSECLSKTAAIPDVAVAFFRQAENYNSFARERLPLYRDAGMLLPAWYEHPEFGQAVDVVAIPLPPDFETRFRLFAINDYGFCTRFDPEIADDAFVIGYPFSETPIGQMPIWKRASIASEPEIDQDRLPKFFIDTATRPGLSGSPVVMQRSGIHGKNGGVLTGNEIIGTIRNFIGIYSGRIGKDETKAQLGIVWKARVIDQIIDGQKFGVLPGSAQMSN